MKNAFFLGLFFAACGGIVTRSEPPAGISPELDAGTDTSSCILCMDTAQNYCGTQGCGTGAEFCASNGCYQCSDCLPVLDEFGQVKRQRYCMVTTCGDPWY